MAHIKAKLSSFCSKNSFPMTIFLLWRAAILLYQLFIEPRVALSQYSDTLTERLYTSWNTYWDAGHYVNIAANGYVYPLQNFFPLWPFTIKLGSIITADSQLASYLLTFVLGLASCILLYELAKRLLEPEKAKTALLLFITFPAAVFLHAGYTESLFLFLTLLSFYLIEKKQYVAAALFGGLTSATRLVGIIMPTLFAVLPIPFKKKIPLILISTIGIVTYCSFLFINYHNPLYFAEAQKHWCKINSNCTITFPVQTLYDKYLILPSVQTIFQEGIGTDTYNWIFSVLFLCLGLSMIKSFPAPYWVYTLGIILFPLTTGSTASMTRYVYLAFPAFFALSKAISNKYLIGIVLLLFSIIQLTFINDFTNFIWVAFNFLLQNQV